MYIIVIVFNCIMHMHSVRTGFEFLAQRVDGFTPKKPKTMNL